MLTDLVEYWVMLDVFLLESKGNRSYQETNHITTMATNNMPCFAGHPITPLNIIENMLLVHAPRWHAPEWSNVFFLHNSRPAIWEWWQQIYVVYGIALTTFQDIGMVTTGHHSQAQARTCVPTASVVLPVIHPTCGDGRNLVQSWWISQVWVQHISNSACMYTTIEYYGIL